MLREQRPVTNHPLMVDAQVRVTNLFFRATHSGSIKGKFNALNTLNTRSCLALYGFMFRYALVWMKIWHEANWNLLATFPTRLFKIAMLHVYTFFFHTFQILSKDKILLNNVIFRDRFAMLLSKSYTVILFSLFLNLDIFLFLGRKVKCNSYNFNIIYIKK